MAAIRTGVGAPAANATEGKVTVATTDPSEMRRVSQTVEKNTAVAATVASGASTANTPAAGWTRGRFTLPSGWLAGKYMKSITIKFSQGTDKGSRQTVLDNITGNDMVIGTGSSPVG
jgi:hypothetical protein